MSTILEAIKLINSKAKVTVENNDINKIEWLEDTKRIPSDEITAMANNEYYKIQRLKEYPTMPDQLDDIYHNGIDAWKATIKAIKDKYPKG
tara:strand:+ start:1188 stop:1460 length:273 start_codon:yes stop_codon:yes gene_type:complete